MPLRICHQPPQVTAKAKGVRGSPTKPRLDWPKIETNTPSLALFAVSILQPIAVALTFAALTVVVAFATCAGCCSKGVDPVCFQTLLACLVLSGKGGALAAARMRGVAIGLYSVGQASGSIWLLIAPSPWEGGCLYIFMWPMGWLSFGAVFGGGNNEDVPCDLAMRAGKSCLRCMRGTSTPPSHARRSLSISIVIRGNDRKQLQPAGGPT